jgi:hypothetical protein
LQGQDGITVPPNGAGIIFVVGAVAAAGTTPFTTTGNAGTSTETWTIQLSQAFASSDATRVGLASFNSAEFTVDANGFVSLAGGGLAVDSFAMQTGTSPVVPTAAGLVTFNGAVVAAGTNPVRTDGTGANTMALEVQISSAIAATDATRIGLAAFNSANFTVDANGFVTLVNGGDLHITPFIVSAAGITNGANYTTIQAAVSAAATAGGGIVYVQPGTYIENITMLPGVNLVGLVGSSGNIGYTISGGEDLPVIIQGNFVLDLTSAVATPTVEFNNITFTSAAGVVFSYVGNIALLESGYITFNNCQLIAGAASTFIFANNGFFNVNLNSTEVSETTPGTTNFISWGATPFLNLNTRNSYININTITALVVPTGSFNVFTLQDTYWSARLDVSAGSQTLSFEAVRCVLAGAGAGAGDPLINFGANDAGLSATNCLINTASGSLANSTSATAAAIFRYNNCIWNNPLTIGATGRGDFSFCEFYGGSSAAITFSSSQNISIINSVVNSTNNPAIAGAGAGTITYEGLVFPNNSAFAGTLTLATVSWRPYAVALAATDGTRVGTCNFNSAHFTVDANGFVSSLGNGFPWIDQATGIVLAVNTGYFVTAATTQTLPAAPTQGQVVKIVADTSGAVVVTANTGQTIRLGSVTSSVAGTMTSTSQGDSMELVFRAATSTWISIADNGVWVAA